MPERTGISVDLADPFLFDRGIPQTVFAELRAKPGLAWNAIGGNPDDGFWAVGRFEEVATVSRDPETYSSAVGHIQIYNIDEDALTARASMIDMDPPEHTRLRRLVNPHFLPRNIKAYVPFIEARVTALLDRIQANGGGDWVREMAKPIPISVICDMLGVPESDHDYMIELTDYLVAGTSSKPLDPNAYGNTTPLRLLPFNSPAAHGLSEYALALGRKRRADPKDDLVTKLVTVEVDGEKLTDSEFANFFRLLIFAGNETTRSAMAHLAMQLNQFPDEFARAKSDPALIETAAEEVVRYASPILYFRRTATRDTELAGTPIKQGERVVMWYASANFDDRRFPDPLRFDISRPRIPSHAGYGGGGIHICLGAQLARLELAILIGEILKRNLKVEIVGAPEYVHSNFVNGIEHLDVRLHT
ncbi:MAG: cytochrome P450 [Hyphomicrobiaceae bacterium]